jgi:hypothetical protein
LDLDSQEVKQCVRKLKENDFELAYLALLTREGLKPLSRWEKPLDDPVLELLQQIGLLTKQIRRTVKTGKLVSETIFSISPGYIQLYEKRFAGKPIDNLKVSYLVFRPVAWTNISGTLMPKMSSHIRTRKFFFIGPVRTVRLRHLFYRCTKICITLSWAVDGTVEQLNWCETSQPTLFII